MTSVAADVVAEILTELKLEISESISQGSFIPRGKSDITVKPQLIPGPGDLREYPALRPSASRVPGVFPQDSVSASRI